MKLVSSVLLALSLVTRAANAQTGSQPKLVLTIFGGVATGNSLWSVARQPYCLPVGTCTSSSLHDTLRLTRDLSSSLIVGAGATYFQSAHLGFTLEVYHLGLPLDDGCTGLFYNPDPPDNRNEQLCNSITSSSPSTSAIALFAGVVLRAASSQAISPYVRGSAGVLSYSSGTVEMSGVFFSNNTTSSRAVIIDDKPKKGAVTVQAAAGLTAQLNPGYQVRLEIRDVLVPLEHVTGAADALGRAPTTTRVHHRIALTLGLDVVLEKKRGRRY